MTESSNTKPVYDLEERTFLFAKRVRSTLRVFSKNIMNEDDIKQLIRSSGSVGANYIEANESLSKKDFHHRVKICRKESKESSYWLRLLLESEDSENKAGLIKLLEESIELKKIFSSICEKSK
jgi:four helix bundle protein